MKRAPVFVALLACAALLGGCSALSEPDVIRVVKDVPVPATPQPAAVAAAPNAGAAGLPPMPRPQRKAGGG